MRDAISSINAIRADPQISEIADIGTPKRRSHTPDSNRYLRVPNFARPVLIAKQSLVKRELRQRL